MICPTGGGGHFGSNLRAVIKKTCSGAPDGFRRLKVGVYIKITYDNTNFQLNLNQKFEFAKKKKKLKGGIFFFHPTLCLVFLLRDRLMSLSSSTGRSLDHLLPEPRLKDQSILQQDIIIRNVLECFYSSTFEKNMMITILLEPGHHHTHCFN